MYLQPTPETDAAVLASNGQWSFVLKTTCERLERERDEAVEALENHKAASIHTCHDQCKRPMCVLRRERDAERALADRLARIVEEGIEGMDLDDIPFFEKAKGTLNAWKEARSE